MVKIVMVQTVDCWLHASSVVRIIVSSIVVVVVVVVDNKESGSIGSYGDNENAVVKNILTMFRILYNNKRVMLNVMVELVNTKKLSEFCSNVTIYTQQYLPCTFNKLFVVCVVFEI